MMLFLVLLLPLAGGVVAWRSGRNAQAIGMGALGLTAIILLDLWRRSEAVGGDLWRLEASLPWIAPLGVHLSLGVDGLSLALTLLTLFLGAIGLWASTAEDHPRRGAFTFCYLASLTGILGVFLSTDLFAFFVFYEVMLVPAYFLLTLWGKDGEGKAAIKFFIFTQTSGLLLLLSILALGLSQGPPSGGLSFNALQLAQLPDQGLTSLLILLGFFIAFAVKLPIVPFHTWQAGTYAAAPASVGILLAGLMSKAGAYGLIRFAVPLLPEAAKSLAPAAIILAAISLVYCGWTALGQRDIKRLIAYSSAGHLAFIVLGVFALNELGYAGAVATLFAHALSVSGLFLLAGHVERSYGTTDLDGMGGLWNTAPRTGALAIVLLMATAGLPGLANFVGEFLTLLGVFRVMPVAAAVGALGALISAIYGLVLLQRVLFGPRREVAATEAARSVIAPIAILVLLLLWLGLAPQFLLNLTTPRNNPMLRSKPAASLLQSTAPATARASKPVETNVDHH